MSKIFDELERLEAASQEAREVPSLVAAPLPVSALPPPPTPTNSAAVRQVINREESILNHRLAGFKPPQAAHPEHRTKSRLLQAFAFDTSMVLIALAVFSGICIAIGGANVFDLTQGSPWLVLVPVFLVGLYWLLPRILRRSTPGTAFARGSASNSPSEPTPSNNRKGFETLGRLSPLPDRARPMHLLKRPLSEELAQASRILNAEGVLDGYGSLSARDDNNPNRIYFAGAEIGEYDLSGKPAAGSTAREHPERFLHCEIYRARPDVMAIVSSQAAEFVPFSVSSVPLLPVLEMADFLVGGVPVFETRSVGPVADVTLRARAIARGLADTLGDKAAILMRGRGAIIVGPSLPVAVGRAYYMKTNARLQAQSILLGGTVNYLEPSELPAPASEFERAQEYWKQRALSQG